MVCSLLCLPRVAREWPVRETQYVPVGCVYTDTWRIRRAGSQGGEGFSMEGTVSASSWAAAVGEGRGPSDEAGGWQDPGDSEHRL